MTDCPICKTKCKFRDIAATDCYKPECSRCGCFTISSEAATMLENIDEQQIVNISGHLRGHSGISINSDDIKYLQNLKTPSVHERATRLLLEIYRLSNEIGLLKTSGLGYTFTLNFANLVTTRNYLGVSFSQNPDELFYLFFNYLSHELNYISCELISSAPTLKNIAITPKGHAYLESLKSTNLLSTIGFCAMWFDKRVLPIWTCAIQPAIQAAGYEPKRIDTHQHNNRIDDEIIAMLRRSKFVVADFAGNRPGVYFEAGYALGLGLQVIWTCNKDRLHRIHFDNRQYNFVTWEWGKLDEFKANLQNRIEATLGRGTLS